MRPFAWLALAITLLALSSPRPARAYDPRHVFITNRGGGNVIELDHRFDYRRTWFDGDLFDGLALDTPNGMAFTPSGQLFIADTFNDRIVALDGTGAFVRAFSVLERLAPNVESIYFDGAGVLYASANPGRGVVARFTQTGGDLPDVVNDPSFLNLGNVNLTNVGTVIVSDFSGANRGLRELAIETGALVRTFGTDLGRQEDVMIDGADRIFVSHFEDREIVVFGPAPERAELYRFASPEGVEPPMTRPTGIALTHDCHVVVASYDDASIWVFRHQGGATPPTFVRVLRAGTDVPADARLMRPESIAIAGLGLPGSFDEFADTVPGCDPLPEVDAGTPADDAGAGEPDAGTGAPGDAGRPPADAGSGASSTSGCGCRAGGGPVTPGAGLLVAMAGALALAGRRRARRPATPQPTQSKGCR